MTKNSKIVLLLVFALALWFDLHIPLSEDEANYWAWSRHLALSYYDGPPMIAYMIRASTAIFGNTVFGVKAVELFCFTLAAYLLHQFAKHLFNAKTAEIALILFLLSPGVQVGYAITTYDAPLTLFWIATLYAFYLALETQKARYLYYTGVLAGLLLLSKYTGVLLLVFLFLEVLLSKTGRQLFKSPHFYAAIMLMFIIFSPVLIWNMQQHWVSFLFQWHNGVATHPVFQLELLLAFLGGQLGLVTPVAFIAFLVLIPMKWKEIWQDQRLRYLMLPFVGTLGFFLYNGLYKNSPPNWPAPAYFSGLIMLGYWIQKYHYRKTYWGIVGVSLVLAIILHLPPVILGKIEVTKPFFSKLYEGYPEMMPQANAEIKPGDLILADTYANASEASFYLQNQPLTYILGSDWISVYTYWSAPLLTQKLTQAWYIGNQPPQLQAYFKHCNFVKNLTAETAFGQTNLVLYHCSN